MCHSSIFDGPGLMLENLKTLDLEVSFNVLAADLPVNKILHDLKQDADDLAVRRTRRVARSLSDGTKTMPAGGLAWFGFHPLAAQFGVPTPAERV